MKKVLCLVLLAFAFSCSSDDNGSDVENGTNKNPNLKRTGSSAHDFLSAEDYETLTIEMLYVGQFKPSDETVQRYKNFLEARLNKPNGITITQRQIQSPGNSPYSLDEIKKLESDNRTLYNNVGNLALCILFVDGKSSSDTSTTATLGTAYLNTSCVIYENTVWAFSNTPQQPSRSIMESTVLFHETGHLLGLVDFGSSMVTDHKDSQHGQHCDNIGCLMYYQSQSNVMNMSNPVVPALDANCIADLQANGGK